MTGDRWLTTKEAAARYSIGEETIRRFIRTGRLEAIKVGNRWRIKESHLTEIIEGGGAQ